MPLTQRVWDFVNRDFKTISPTATLGEAMESLSQQAEREKGRMSLVVVDENMKPLGVISMRNILEAFKSEFKRWTGLLGKGGLGDALQKGLKQADYRLVQDYMVKVPHLSMGDDLLHAYEILTARNLQTRIIPVVEVGKVEGVVRIPDLFEAFFETYKKI